MWPHLISHLISQKTEHWVQNWVEAGQRTDPIQEYDPSVCYLSFGFRYRLQNLITCFIFTAVSTNFFPALWNDLHFDLWLVLIYSGIILPIAIVSLVLALSALTTRITLMEEGFVIRRFGIESKLIEWSEISKVYRSHVTSAIVFLTNDRRRIYISTQLDGIEAILAYLRHVFDRVDHHSIMNWIMSMPLSHDEARRTESDFADDRLFP